MTKESNLTLECRKTTSSLRSGVALNSPTQRILMTLQGCERSSYLWAPNLLLDLPTHTLKITSDWDAKNYNEAWIEAKGWGQSKVVIGEEQPNGWTAGVLRLSRWKTKSFMSPITGHTEVSNHRHKPRGAATLACRLCGDEETTTHTPCDCEALSIKRRPN